MTFKWLLRLALLAFAAAWAQTPTPFATRDAAEIAGSMMMLGGVNAVVVRELGRNRRRPSFRENDGALAESNAAC